jgi:chaperonin GroEL
VQLRYAEAIITNDDVTVAKEIELPNPVENIGAPLLREVASKTSDITRYGALTATVLAGQIYHEGMKRVRFIDAADIRTN